MEQYLEVAKNILESGRIKGKDFERTGTGTCNVFGTQVRYDLTEGFPLVTSRKMFTNGIKVELEMFLTGITDNTVYEEKGCRLWSQWAVQDDVVMSAMYEPHERLSLYAKMSGMGMQEALDDVQSQGALPIGMAYLDDKGIPRERDVVAVKGGDLGPIYSSMWTNWPNPDGTTTNQIAILMENLRDRPDSRRHVVSAWNPSFLPDERISPQENVKLGKACLAYCHPIFQFYSERLLIGERMVYGVKMGIVDIEVYEGLNLESEAEHELAMLHPDYTVVPVELGAIEDVHGILDDLNIPRIALSCLMFARSQDYMIGTPSNIASYSMLTHIIADQLGYGVGEYIHTTGDTHIYSDQIELAKVQVEREPLPLCKLQFTRKPKDIFDFKASDIEFVDYVHQEAIKYPVAM